MTALLSALGSGISANKILEYLMRQSPELAPKITKSLAAGVSADKLLKFFSKDKNFEKLTSSFGKEYSTENNANPMVQGENIRGKNLGQDPASALQRNLPGIAGGIAAGAALPFASRAAQSALSRALPSSLQKFGVQPLQTNNQTPSNANNSLNTALVPISQLPQSQNQSNISPQPPVNSELGNISKQKEITQPKGISNPKEYLEKKGVLQSVNESLKRGNSPEQVAVELGIKRSGNAKIDPDLLKNIEEYAKQTQEAENLAKNGEIPVDQEKISPKIEKTQTVSSPKGIGEVKEIRNGQAIIDIDGKKHKVAVDELEQSPIPEKDLAELHDELIKGIESETGEDVSRMVQWAGYNPNTNTLQFLPHTGKLYKYGNISPEDAALLTDILSVRKSSGANFIGAWKAGSKSPIGAALSKLIKKLQSERGGKGNEYEETHEPIYSAYEPAIEAKKKKKK